MIHSFYVGCYTKKAHDAGIHLLRFDTESGGLCRAASYYGGESPSFLTRAGHFLYAANEIGNTGKVSALSVNADGALAYLNSAETPGAATCHAALINGFLYAANYGDGSIFGTAVRADGSLGAIVAQVRHEGGGPNPNRQKGPHAHSVTGIPNSDLLIAADLGADRLFCYRQKPDGSLTPDAASPAIPAPAGGGPRHIAAAASGKRFFAVMEMGVSMAGFTKAGAGWQADEACSLLAEDVTEADSAADIHFAANETRLYATVRGKNLIAAFDIDANGVPKRIGAYPTFGDSPRSFCLSADESFVLIAHQASGHVTACPVDKQTGAVGAAVGSVVLDGASCVIKA